MKTIAALAVVLMATATAQGQVVCCPTTCPPVVVLPTDYDNIHFTGTVYSKTYVRVRTPEGSLVVPVINGILPRLTSTRHANGSVTRNYYYDTNVRWKNDGRMPVYDADNQKPLPRTYPGDVPSTLPLPRTLPRTYPDTPEFKELPGLNDIRRDNESLKRQNQLLEERLRTLGSEVDRIKNQPQPTPTPPAVEKKDLPLFDDLQKLEKSVSTMKSELEVIRTLNNQDDQDQVKRWENSLREMREEIKLLQEKNKPVNDGLPPIIDPNTAIPRNTTTPSMTRPSEIK